MSATEFIIRSKIVVVPEGVRSAAIHVRDEKIAALLPYDDIPAGLRVEDVGDSVIMPGLVDTHVHINEPGRTEWEGFETATKAAAAGGITTLVDMPLNSSPVTTTLDALRSKLNSSEGKRWVDCGFYGGVIPGNAQHVQPLIDGGVLGFKAFLVHSGIDEFPNATEHDLRLAMPIIAEHNLPLLVHCELAIGNPKSEIKDPQSYSHYLASRPRQWEHDAIALMIRLCRKYRCRTHIVHLSSADALPMLSKARSEGLPLTVETCPHYLYFTAEEIPDGDTRYKCAPPIREQENRERLWGAAQQGIIDMIVSDHSPSTPNLKCMDTGNFQKAWGGIASLQFGLSIIWTEARRRGCTFADIARWMSKQPAELVNIGKAKGSIAPGYDADLVVWNPDEQFTVDPSFIYHRHKLTPYEGRTLFGKVVGTYLRGTKIFDRGSFHHIPLGKSLRSSQ
jgi:allantoinase